MIRVGYGPLNAGVYSGHDRTRYLQRCPQRLWLKLIAQRGGLVPPNEKTSAGSLAEPEFVCSACAGAQTCGRI